MKYILITFFILSNAQAFDMFRKKGKMKRELDGKEEKRKKAIADKDNAQRKPAQKLIDKAGELRRTSEEVSTLIRRVEGDALKGQAELPDDLQMDGVQKKEELKRRNAAVVQDIDKQVQIARKMLVTPDINTKLKSDLNQLIGDYGGIRHQFDDRAKGKKVSTYGDFEQNQENYSDRMRRLMAIHERYRADVTAQSQSLETDGKQLFQRAAIEREDAVGKLNLQRTSDAHEFFHNLYVDSRLNGISSQLSLQNIDDLVRKNGIKHKELLIKSITGKGNKLREQFDKSALAHYIDNKSCELLPQCRRTGTRTNTSPRRPGPQRVPATPPGTHNTGSQHR